MIKTYVYRRALLVLGLLKSNAKMLFEARVVVLITQLVTHGNPLFVTHCPATCI